MCGPPRVLLDIEVVCATCHYNTEIVDDWHCLQCVDFNKWTLNKEAVLNGQIGDDHYKEVVIQQNEPVIKIKLVHPDAKVPKYAMPGDVGMDLAIVEDAFIPGKSVLAYPTGIIMEIPEGFELELRPRSSFPFKYPGVFLANSPGTIDSQFRGEIKIILYNSKAEMQFIPKGTRIVQGIIHKVYQLPQVIVNEVSETERGSSGIGSTGSN